MENKDLKLTFKAETAKGSVPGSFAVYFVNNFNMLLYGEYIYSHIEYYKDNSAGRCFYYEGKTIGIWNNLAVVGRCFHSLYNPGKTISEYEYKKELANIRLDINNAPPAFFYLDVRVPENWKEIFTNELEDLKNKYIHK